ncbi:hypothetical protein AAFF_G00051720 [Aldrovandia affinis]|uniref:Uncharacterized protein n=1 Tax=Aldrovandia affinis TaxID=143900 RepID=A0AAD7T4H9_9TELE|nr:hypothetical protein AAFF_G00051720 [Aldrovandia affinis]
MYLYGLDDSEPDMWSCVSAAFGFSSVRHVHSKCELSGQAGTRRPSSALSAPCSRASLFPASDASCSIFSPGLCTAELVPVPPSRMLIPTPDL